MRTTRFTTAFVTIAIAAGVWLVGAAGEAAAQFAGDEQIDSYSSEAVVQSDAVHVTETIDYDFGANPRHGIKRYIQVRYDLPDGSPIVPKGESSLDYERVTPVDVKAVTATEAPDEVSVEHSGQFDIIRIGDPDVTVTGKHTYTIEYAIKGVFNTVDGLDEFPWNATGNGWEIPIANVTASVAGPAAITKANCFYGPYGATTPCPIDDAGGQSANFGASGLGPREGLTYAIAMPVGTVDSTPILERKWSVAHAFSVTPATVGGAGALFVVLAVLIAASVWRVGRDRRYIATANPLVASQSPIADDADAGTAPTPIGGKTEAPVEFRPPDGIRPGQLGVVIDEIAHPLDITATIVDLAVRGYLRIEETDAPDRSFWSTKKGDWRFYNLRSDYGELAEYEKTLLHSMFDETSGQVDLTDLKYEFASKMRLIQNELYDNVVANRWFARRPDRVRTLWSAIGWAITIAGVVATVALAAKTSYGLVPIPIVLAGLFFVVANRLMPRRTAKGSAMLARIVGFRRYMETAEVERMEFAEKQNVFETLLPYAIVFGLTDQWAKRFASLADDPNFRGLSWYGGYGGYYAFNAVYFASAMTAFSTTTSGTLVSTPPSSGGGSSFGGGGFSGGGFGGGGGGSW